MVSQSVSPTLSPSRIPARSSGRPRKDVIPSSTPSVESPPPDLQTSHGINQFDIEPPPPPPDLRLNQRIDKVNDAPLPKTITSHPVEPKNVELDRAQPTGPVDTTTPLPELGSGACQDGPLEGQSSAAPADSNQAAAPAKPPAPPVPRAQSVLQSRAVSISSSREPSVSRLSTVGSLSTMSPRTTPDPSLIDAKPFVASFKAGGANAIRERRRQQQAELEEKRRKKREAEKLANSATGSVPPKD